jgi:hypothetical protein
VLCEVLRLVRPCSYVLALGLDLVASEVYIPLIQRCLRALCYTLVGLVVLQDHTNQACDVGATVYRREQGPWWFSRKLDSEDGGSSPGEACWKAHRRPTRAWGRTGAIHGVTQPGAWPLRGIPCEGLQRGLEGSLSASRYLGKNTRVIDGSLHISTLLFTFRILYSVPRLLALLS